MKVLRRLLGTFIALGLSGSLLLYPANIARSEECPSFDFGKIFDEEFYPDIRWNLNTDRVIKWTTDASEVEGKPVVRPFTEAQSSWLDIAFKSWDLTSDKINFVRVGPGQDYDVAIGLIKMPDPNNHGFWNIARRGDFRVSGAISINADSKLIEDKQYFLEVTQSEIGNLLGLGDVSNKYPADTVMMDPDIPPFGSYPLSEFDIGMIRQFYGESTCPTSWPGELKTLKAKIAKEAEDAAALAKAAEEARLKAEAELAAKLAAAAKLTPSPTPSASPTKTTIAKKTTITCVKGQLTKKVTAVNPKCPKGYKKK